MVRREGSPGGPASAEGRTSTPLDRFVASVLRFAQAESAGGLVLFVATVAALVWANSPWSRTYTEIWQTPLAVGISEIRLEKPLQLWVNDGLMAIFFFVVGLEIKREVRFGALASPRSALLPVVAAGGGALVPALVYLAFTAGTDAARG